MLIFHIVVETYCQFAREYIPRITISTGEMTTLIGFMAHVKALLLELVTVCCWFHSRDACRSSFVNAGPFIGPFRMQNRQDFKSTDREMIGAQDFKDVLRFDIASIFANICANICASSANTWRSTHISKPFYHSNLNWPVVSTYPSE
jgi:hypothetical protein